MGEMAREYIRKSKDEVADILYNCKSCLILFHVNPDGDAAASAFALKAMLAEMGKEAFCLCAQPLPERLQFVMNNQAGVTAENISDNSKFDLIVSVDTASPSQLGSLYASFKGKIDLMIDHHKMGEVYADNYILNEASSCGEVVWTLFEAISEKYAVDIPFAAKYLVYTAISSDTGCFRYNNVHPLTFEIAARLLVLISGHNKARALRHCVEGGVDHAWTISALQLHKDGIIACDEAACGELKKGQG